MIYGKPLPWPAAMPLPGGRPGSDPTMRPSRCESRQATATVISAPQSRTGMPPVWISQAADTWRIRSLISLAYPHEGRCPSARPSSHKNHYPYPQTAIESASATSASDFSGSLTLIPPLVLGRLRLLVSFLPSGKAVEKGVEAELESGLAIDALAVAGRLSDEQ